MRIAIASGKGGTGKTTVAVNLYYQLSKYLENQVQLIDCDVEEPNDLLFIPKAEKSNTNKVYSLVPKIDREKCTFCKKCSEWCEFNAISIVKNLKFAEVNKDLCHSCGACSVACNFDAISEYQNPIGTISEYTTTFGSGVIEGRLEIGSSMQTSLIRALKKQTNNPEMLQLLDAPPGTSCPVVETVSGAAYVILVTEPTPFGEYDLMLTVELLNDLKIPFGVIVNKAGLGNHSVYEFLNKNKIELIGEIPFSKEFAVNYSRGALLDQISEEMEIFYQSTAERLLELTGIRKLNN
ncbi:ATP-binding protein [Maribellus sp. YY47]|uniref:nucleotide-binding protein n=1 Tax=Maribellus sp. YY47 TaxID=2929486 RepID=UPI0020018C2F|nr:ATP-binding protein [Maribellus sp. YY47]MCK3684920.1 ATP-binding protein [Maribellus sp. YY47]